MTYEQALKLLWNTFVDTPFVSEEDLPSDGPYSWSEIHSGKHRRTQTTEPCIKLEYGNRQFVVVIDRDMQLIYFSWSGNSRDNPDCRQLDELPAAAKESINWEVRRWWIAKDPMWISDRIKEVCR